MNKNGEHFINRSFAARVQIGEVKTEENLLMFNWNYHNKMLCGSRGSLNSGSQDFMELIHVRTKHKTRKPGAKGDV